MSRMNSNFNIDTMSDQIDLSLLFFGKEECLSGHFWGPGLRDSYLLHYVHQGSGRFSIAGTTHTVTAGGGFIIPPHTIVHYQADDDDPWVYSWIGFKGLHAKSLLRRAGLSSSQLTFDCRHAPSFESFFDDLLYGRSQRSGDVLNQSILYRIMADLISCSPESDTHPKPTHSKENYIHSAIGFIENNYSQKITIMDIATSVGLDRTYLSGLFKAKFGISLQHFLLEYRMKRAADLLHNPELSVSDISRSVGYQDPFLFSKMFKKVLGSSPRNFQKSITGEIN